jgi:hypothetical protein
MSTAAASSSPARLWLYSFENHQQTIFLRAAGRIVEFPATFHDLVQVAQSVLSLPLAGDDDEGQRYGLRFFLHPPAITSSQSGIDRASGAELLEATFHLLRDNDAVEVMRIPIAETSPTREAPMHLPLKRVLENATSSRAAKRPAASAVNVLFVTPEAKVACRPLAAELQASPLAVDFLKVRMYHNQPLQFAFEAFKNNRNTAKPNSKAREYRFLSTHYAIANWNAFIRLLQPTDTLELLKWTTLDCTMIIIAHPIEESANPPSSSSTTEEDEEERLPSLEPI